jgi:Domain of unknown function (DUF4347)/Domain of unknown function (DUF4082)
MLIDREPESIFSLASLSISNQMQYADLLQTQPFVSGSRSSTPHTIAFVDAHVADVMTIMAGLKSDVKVLLDPTRDGIEQITKTLSYYKGLTGIEIVSHGNVAQVQLGQDALNANNIQQYSHSLQQWSESLAPEADILFYGCNVAAGAAGQAFVRDLSKLTGADIAASTDVTGNSNRGGNWTLEYSTGRIETATPLTDSLMSTYSSLLASVFSPTTTPQYTNVSEGSGSVGDYELGMEFTSAKAGQINAIRYYKAPSETGSHIGQIWSSTGQLLASVNFTNETASGWQQQELATSLSIAANTTYLVSVNANSYYAITLNGLATTISNGDLSAVADGSNGVFNTTPGQFPTQSYNHNYFRDIVFSPSSSESVFSPTTTPQYTNVSEGSGSVGDYELGMEFTSAKAGQINAIRYYKAPSETGSHIGQIWSSTGQLLASVNFTNETASGWQQQTLATSLSIAANTTYLVSVNANSYYAITLNGLATTISNGDLSAVADGSNGVFNTTPGQFPTQSYNHNYFRDIVFSPSPIPNNHLGTASITGTATQNQTLTANVNDVDGLSGVTINYQWQQSSNNGNTWSNITGATSKTFSLGQAQVNQQVRVRAIYTDTLGSSENILSTSTSAVVNVNDLGIAILAGSATTGANLKANIVDVDGLAGVNINYQWQRLVSGNWTNIAGATAQSLTLTTTLLGLQVRSLATYIDALGSSENTVTSGVTVAAQNAIVLENQKAGTTAWQISATNLATNDEISGYADATSINKGQALNLKVSLAQAGRYRLDVYRLGYYGGAGGRLISSSNRLNGVTQSAPTTDPTTRLVEYNWNNSYTLQTNATWTTGLYLVKLTDSLTGKQNYVNFVLRDDNRPADLGFQDAANTAQAYNNDGGYSVYDFNSNNSQPAYKVSFNRPLNQSETLASNVMISWEYNMARWMESQGYDVSYYSNLDVHINPLQLYSQKTFLSVGHDEYWSMEMRNSVEQARDNGTNLAFFSANTAYWRVRFEPSSTGQPNRTMVVYKENWNLDPIAQQDSSQATTRFRSTELNRPENALLGGMYKGFNVIDGGFDYVVRNASDPYYANTGLNNGDTLPGLVGFEWDGIINNGFTPAGLVILSESPVSQADPDIAPSFPPGTDTTIANAVRYTAPSGAKVFSTGSVNWVWGLSSDRVPNPRVDQRAQQIAVNVLKDMGAKPKTPSPGIVVG